MLNTNEMTYFDFYNFFVISVSIECVGMPFDVSAGVFLFYVGSSVIYRNARPTQLLNGNESLVDVSVSGDEVRAQVQGEPFRAEYVW
jgi:hypothetical protein